MLILYFIMFIMYCYVLTCSMSSSELNGRNIRDRSPPRKADLGNRSKLYANKLFGTTTKETKIHFRLLSNYAIITLKPVSAGGVTTVIYEPRAPVILKLDSGDRTFESLGSYKTKAFEISLSNLLTAQKALFSEKRVIHSLYLLPTTNRRNC